MERLRVAERAHLLALAVYRETCGWSDRALALQVRRCALSIPSNIVEGASRESRREFARYIGIAFSSAAEARYQLRFAHEVGLMPTATYERLDRELSEIRRMLWALLTKLRGEPRERPAAQQNAGSRQ